jgi:hypothetical protein
MRWARTSPHRRILLTSITTSSSLSLISELLRLKGSDQCCRPPFRDALFVIVDERYREGDMADLVFIRTNHQSSEYVQGLGGVRFDRVRNMGRVELIARSAPREYDEDGQSGRT